MRLALGFRNKLAANLDVQEGKYSLYPVRQQFDQIKSRIVAGWNIDHKPDGHHGDIVADSVTCDEIVLSDAGILLPTTGGSSDTNTLDAYKEGNWTPTGNGITLTSAAGRYTKIGRVVFCTAHVTFPATADGGEAKISGLPFPVPNVQQDRGGGVAYTALTGGAYFLLNLNASTGTFYSISGATQTNANMTGVENWLSFFYSV